MIDECQMVLNASVKWRAKMLELVQMMDKRVQMIFFTATKRAKDEEELEWVGGIEGGWD